MPSPYKIVWTRTAERDLVSIVEFIAAENPRTALKILKRIRLKAATLKRDPNRGRRLPELAHLSVFPFREIIVPPWRLIYRIREKTVQILSLLDSRRDLEDLLLERLTHLG